MNRWLVQKPFQFFTNGRVEIRAGDNGQLNSDRFAPAFFEPGFQEVSGAAEVLLNILDFVDGLGRRGCVGAPKAKKTARVLVVDKHGTR